jgi:hypothetical protein
MPWIELANFLKRGIAVQNEQDDVKPGFFHMELFSKKENKKSWWWQLQIFTGNLIIGRTGYKISDAALPLLGPCPGRLRHSRRKPGHWTPMSLACMAFGPASGVPRVNAALGPKQIALNCCDIYQVWYNR